MTYENTLAFAQQMDEQDSLRKFRNEFHIPQHNGKDAIYLTGNSLGLQPKGVKAIIEQELDDWSKLGVEGHFEAKRPWFAYHEFFTEKMAKIVGGKSNEIVMMNGLTTNIHLLMVSFYRPTKKRFKIICEAKAFPSDQYVLESQVKHHGLNTDDAIIEVGPRDGEHTIRLEDVLSAIERAGDELALVMIGGVNYYSGQVFDMKSITEAAHKVGAIAGFDLAHGAGNIELKLNEWNVDFAAWCSYKYLNAGPGGISGVYINEKHSTNTDLPRFAGWWGHNKETRFLMKPGFQAMKTAEAWQLSNAPIFSMAPLLASLELFDEAGMRALNKKANELVNYFAFVFSEVDKNISSCDLEIITPTNEAERGCQLSVLAHGQGKDLFDKLTENGIIADWREPNVIRMAPVPLYNSFEDLYRFGEILYNILK